MIVKINCFMVLLPFRQKLLSRDKGYILSLCVDHILFHFALPYQGLNESLSLHCSTVQIRIFWLYNTLLSFHLLVFLMYLQKYCESRHSKYHVFEMVTKEERHLWYDFLKPLPVTVHRQKVLGRYIVDFYIAEAKMVIALLKL